MSRDTKIEWCDHTFNPWEGCSKISPGCAHCYAAARNARFGGGTASNWGPGAPRRRTSKHNWQEPLRWNLAARAGARRPRVFCASLADWLDDEVPADWLADLIELIEATPHLDWLLLTKRPENWRPRLSAIVAENSSPGRKLTHVAAVCSAWLSRQPPSNVWIGTTVEDQDRAQERIWRLLSIPATVRFLSCEPLLGPVDLLAGAFDPPNSGFAIMDGFGRVDDDEVGIHWVICGGESGPCARPMHPSWARSLRDQCRAAGVPFFFKQWGAWVPFYDSAIQPGAAPMLGKKERWLSLAGEAEFNGHGTVAVRRVGKKAAGRFLDLRQWSEFPVSASSVVKTAHP